MTGLKGHGRAGLLAVFNKVHGDKNELTQTDSCACFVYNRCTQLRPHLLQTIVLFTP